MLPKFKNKFITNDDMSGFCESVNKAFIDTSIYFDYFKNIALNLFIWDGLPESCNAEFLEETLFWHGRACFIKEPISKKIWNLKYSPTGTLDIYNLPTAITAYSNLYSRTFKRNKDEFVLVRNNISYIPTVRCVQFFTNKIAKIEQTIEVNLEAQKTPITFAGSKEQTLAMENLYNKFRGNVPYIFLNKAQKDAVQIDVFKTDAPFLADKMYDMKERYKHEFLTFLGINNLEEKAERLLVDEINTNNQFISLNFETMFDSRRKACAEINKMWGLDVSVRPRTDLYPTSLEREGIDNGNLYNLA